MAVNKVVYGTTVLVDLTADTVTPETLVEGFIAHGKNGEKIVGTLKVPKTDRSLTYPFSYKFQYSETEKEGYIYGM